MLGRVSKSQEGQKKLHLKYAWWSNWYWKVNDLNWCINWIFQLSFFLSSLIILNQIKCYSKLSWSDLVDFMVIEGRLEKLVGKHTKKLPCFFSPGKKWDPSQIRSWSKEWGKHYFSPIEIIVIQAGAELGQAQLKLRLDLPCQTPASYLV